MKKYRIAYDYMFSPRDLDKGFYYKGERIIDIAFYAIFKVINKVTGEEKFFEGDEKLEYTNNKFCYLFDFYQCEIDKDELFKMILNKKLFDESDYDITFEIGDCFKWPHPATPVKISHNEFIDILQNNFSEFDNFHNKPTQKATCYYINNPHL